MKDQVVSEAVLSEASLPHSDPGLQVLARVKQDLEVEPQWCLEDDRGFTWWPTRLAQRIYADPPREGQGGHVTVVHVECDVLRDVPEGSDTAPVLEMLNREATVAAFLWDHTRREIRLHASFAVGSDAPGVDALATAAAFVQVGELARQVQQIAASIPGSVVDESPHPRSGLRSTPSPEVFRLYRWCCEEGRKPSVFPFFSEVLPRDRGDQASTILRIDTTFTHPVMGAGALVTLDLPFTPPGAQHVERLLWDEVSCPFDGFLMGSYATRPNVVFRLFLPNVVGMQKVLDYVVWIMAARSAYVRELVDLAQPTPLAHTDVMQVVATGLTWWDAHDVPARPSDTNDLFAFACLHERLDEFWSACPRSEWMLWVLGWAVGVGIVERPQMDLARFKVAPVAEACRLAEWLTAEHLRAQALRELLPAPFENISRTWLDASKRDVDISLRRGDGPVEERLVVRRRTQATDSLPTSVPRDMRPGVRQRH